MESISRLSHILDVARELTLDAARDASLNGFRRSAPESQTSRINTLLRSRSDVEIIDGLKQVVGLLYTSPDAAVIHFTEVLKTISSPSAEIRKLVAVVLTQLAVRQPDTALLAINILQKSLTEPNAGLRALALRTMSSLRVPAIAQIVLLAIKRGAADPSILVRRTAAFAIHKAVRLSPSTVREPLRDILDELLSDEAHLVTGAAVQVMAIEWPGDDELVDGRLEMLVDQMIDMDEWAQVALLRLLLFYCRRNFPQPKEGETTHPEIIGFLSACLPLLASRNSAVILAAARCLLYLGDGVFVDPAIGRLLALMRCPADDILPIALQSLAQICSLRPHLFARLVPRFLVRAVDPSDVACRKIDILSTLFAHASPVHRVLVQTELEHLVQTSVYGRSNREIALSRAAVKALGSCAISVQETDAEVTSHTLRFLLGLVADRGGRRSLPTDVMAQVLSVVRALVGVCSAGLGPAVTSLVPHLSGIADPSARATVLWLVGELAISSPDSPVPVYVLSKIMVGDRTWYADEQEECRLQAMLLAAKLYLCYLVRQSSSDGFDSNNPAVVLYTHSTSLARFDSSTDVRDRNRLYRALLPDPVDLQQSERLDRSATQLAELVLTPTKQAPKLTGLVDGRTRLVIGTSTNLLAEQLDCLGLGEQPDSGRDAGLLGFELLPGWAEVPRERISRRQAAEPGARGWDRTGVSSSDIKRQTKSGHRTGGNGMTSRQDGRLHVGSRGPAQDKTDGQRRVVKSLDDWLAEDDEPAGTVGAHNLAGIASQPVQTQAESESADEDGESGSDSGTLSSGEESTGTDGDESESGSESDYEDGDGSDSHDHEHDSGSDNASESDDGSGPKESAGIVKTG